MKINKLGQDVEEETPIIPLRNSNDSNSYKNHNYNFSIIIVSILVFSFIFFTYFKLFSIISKLQLKVDEMEEKVKDLEEYTVRRKINIAFIQPSIYGNGMGRILTVLTGLLAQTGLYDVYIINEKTLPNEFPVHPGVKRVIQKKTKEEIVKFDKENKIQIYVLNNDLSDFIEIYKSLNKKVVGIFHGVFLSCIFTNNTVIYRHWGRFNNYDSFVHIIADDYWVYKKFNFSSLVYVPNLYTFDHTKTPTSNLTYKNALIVGRIDDIIKGAQFGVKAMAEAIKEVPDAQLIIVSGYQDPKIKELVKELNIEKNVRFMPFSQNISEYYLNASVLIVGSVSESFPMVMNEGKAHGLPIVAHNIDYSPCYQEGVITVELFDYKAMGKEIAKLLNDYDYRKRKGMEAKYSLDMYNNNDTIKTWGELFRSLLKGKNEYHKFQEKIEKKYYNEKLAMERIKKHYHYAQKFNKMFSCHSFENFTDLNYLQNIKECNLTK